MNGAPAAPELLWRKHLALLIYLARSSPRPRSREHLTALLWSEKPDAAGRHSLTEAIRVLRRYAGDKVISTPGGQVLLDADTIDLDVARLVHATEQRDWQQAAGLVSGEFMEGFVVSGASMFEDWLAAERAHWRAQSVNALVQRASQLEQRGRAADASAYALRATMLDPRSELALRTAMRCLALAGDRLGALQRYDTFRAGILGDLDVEPDRATTALADRIRRERGTRLPRRVDAGGRSDVSAVTTLIGREAELTTLLATAEHCSTARRPSLLVIEGEAGAGKSRLLEELVKRLRLGGATVCLTRAVEADRDDGNGALLALARDGLAEAPGVAGAPPASIALLADVVAEWQERFPFSRDAGEACPTLARALTDVLRAAAQESLVVLAIDDAYWLDRSSAVALGAILRDLEELPVALVLAVQPALHRSELDELRARIGRDIGGVSVTLGHLGSDDLRTLARGFLPGYTDVEIDRVCRRVSTDSAGLPLLATELLRAVAAGLDLGSVSGAWPEPFKTLDQTLPGDLPDAVVAAVRVRFRSLTGTAQRILAAAAVMPERIEKSELMRATGIAAAEVQSALDEIEWQRWLSFDPRGYSFGARLIREVIARDMLTPGQRRRILSALGDHSLTG